MKKTIASLLAYLVFITNAYSATLINDGDINWGGTSWQTTGKASTLNATTTVSATVTTSQYSVSWQGVETSTDIGLCVFPVIQPVGSTFTVGLQEGDDAYFTSSSIVASTTMFITAGTNLVTWNYYKFNSGYNENPAKYYRTKITGSSASASAFRVDNSSLTKVATIQVLSTKAEAAASDTIYVMGVIQGSVGTPSSATVTVDISSSSTIFGGITIASSGTLTYQNTPGSTYYLKFGTSSVALGGSVYAMWVQPGGAVNIVGNLATLSTLEVAPATALENLIQVDYPATFSSTGKNNIGTNGSVFRTTTTTNVLVGNSSVTVTDDIVTAGWAAGDVITISATGARNQTEHHRILSFTGNYTINIATSTFAYAHAFGCEVTNLSRNVVITCSTQTTGTSRFSSNGVLNFNYTQFGTLSGDNPPVISTPVFSGASAATMFMSAATASTTINGCSLLGIGSSSRYIIGQNNSGQTLIILNSIFYRYALLAISLYGGYQAYNINGLSIMRPYANSGTCFPVSLSNYITVTMRNVNVYDDGTTTGYGFAAVANVNQSLFIYCKAWFMSAAGSYIGSNMWNCFMVFKNCYFGSDGTNGGLNNAYDISNAGSQGIQGTVLKFYNCLFKSANLFTTSGWNMTANELLARSGAFLQRYNQTAGRYKSYVLNGYFSDNTTVAMADQSGSGTCLMMTPSSNTSGQTLNWEFYVPVSTATDPQIKFYTKTTGGTPTLNIDVYDDSDNNTLLVNNESISLSTTWTQYSVTSVSPTSTGFCKVVLKALGDVTPTESIGIDTLSYVSESTTYTYNFEEWADGLPLVAGASSGASAGTSAYTFSQ